MPGDTRHICPVCHRRILRTSRDLIGGHHDKAGHICPGSHQPFDIAATPPYTPRKAAP